MITVQQLVDCGIDRDVAGQFELPLDAAMAAFGINTPKRAAAFLAQAAHESVGFTRLQENLSYSTPERLMEVFKGRFSGPADAAQYLRQPEKLANRVYANRLGNGDTSSGDGWRFRGRGLFQLTGRANYMAAGDGLGTDYKANPDLVAEPPDAAFTAAWYWAVGNLNAMADVGQIDVITRRINGPAMLGADERRALYQRFLQVLA
jgi:putative chitinase